MIESNQYSYELNLCKFAGEGWGDTCTVYIYEELFFLLPKDLTRGKQFGVFFGTKCYMIFSICTILKYESYCMRFFLLFLSILCDCWIYKLK